MDSKPHVPFSATPTAVQAYPYKSSLSSSTSSGSFLIRAPLTIDDDDDDLESGSHKSINDTDTGDATDGLSNTDTEGFVSGEEYDTASERPFLADPDEEISEKIGFVDKLKISKRIVADPDEEYSQKSTVDDEESSVGVEYDGPEVDMALVDNPKMKPIAQLSMDDDDDDGVDEFVGGEEGMVSEVEDGGFSYVAKVPSVGYLERLDSAPRIKVMENEGGGEDEPFSEPPSPLKSVDSSVSPSGEALLGNKSLNDSASAEVVEDKGDSFVPETRFKSNVEGKEDVFEVVDNAIEREPLLENSAQENRDGNEMKECVDKTVVTVLEDLKIEEAGVGAGEQPDCQNDKCSSVDVSRSLSLDQRGDKENLESKPEREIGLAVHFHDPLPVISVDSTEETQIGDSKFLVQNSTLQNANFHALTGNDRLEDAESSGSSSFGFVKSSLTLDQNIKPEAELDVARIGGRQNGVVSDEGIEELLFGGSEATKQFMNELEERLASSSIAGTEGSQGQSEEIHGQIIMNSEDEGNTDSDGEKNELFGSDALAALLKTATSAGSDGGGLTITSSDSSRVFTFEKPRGSGSSFPSTRSAPPAKVDKDASKDKLSDEEKERIEQIQLLRVKFLRLVKRIGHSLDDSIVAQVLYRLALAMGSPGNQAFSHESTNSVATLCEAEGKDDLDFSLNILVLGKTGVGKSATINSLFGEEKATIDAFEPATTSVKLIAGVIDGVKIKILDTPGLRSPVTEQSINRRILASIKKFMKKFTPDVLLYVDRLDTHTRDDNDLLLLRSLTSSLSSSIWQNAILCLTHAASDLPDGPSGSPLSYEVFVAQQSRVIQRGISLAVGDLRLMNPSMMHPVSLVENHPYYQKKIGERLLPNGQSWRTQLLLLCFSLKILAEANSMSKSRDPFHHKKLFGFRRSAPLSYLLSSLLQSRTHPKLSADQGGDNIDSDVELCYSSDSEQEEEEEYSQLPPFKPLRKSQVVKLSKEQREAYFEEYDYRVKLLQKKQWKEEVRRLREIKKKGDGKNYGYHREDEDHEDESPATIPVTLPDFVLLPSFDGDNPTYRYRLLEPSSELLVRPVLDSHGWDHDCGYDGVSLERNLAIAGQFPGALAVQITKDKKEFNFHLDSSISTKCGENGSTMAGLDVQTVGRQLAYILRGETKFRNFRINKTCAGLSITLLGENVATGLKVEDQIALGKGLVLAGNAGAVQSQGDAAYGANVELRLKDKDFPVVQDQSSLGLSLMNWRGDLTLMANLQSQLSIGRSSKMAVRIGLNNKRSGQITVKLSSSEQLQMAIFGILPVAISIFRSIFSASGGKS